MPEAPEEAWCQFRPNTVYQLWTSLTERIKDKHNKQSFVKIFYSWITNNIVYDIDKYRQKNNNNITDSDVLNVNSCPAEIALKEGKALCVGYVDLFWHLCW